MIADSQHSFLFRLTERLAAGLKDFDPARAARHKSFLLSFQQADGGFAGREGGSDLYYTSFAVRGLAVLNGLERPCRDAIARYLEGETRRKRYSLIDLVSWFYSAIAVELAGGLNNSEETLIDEVCAALEHFRRSDGGYAKTLEGGSSSTYHTFLAALCYEMLGRTPPEPGEIVRFVLTRQREDGGFVEIGPMKRSGTNPTAAAAMLLKRFEVIDHDLFGGIGSYLEKVKGIEGGFRANTQIPFCDLLSTFTGLLMARDLGLPGVIDVEACKRYVNQLELHGGGFRGASWDSQADAEYTFYGLGSLALLGLS